MNGRKHLIAGNWKMNLGPEESESLVRAIAEQTSGIKDVDVLVAPPFTNLYRVKKAISDAPIFLAAQNMHWEPSGAYTGEISAAMILDAGCSHVILGHSERRALFSETDEMVAHKSKAAVENGLIPIICIGETLEEREAGRTFDVIKSQLKGSLKYFIDDKKIPDTTTLAYEPVWAIGTGKTATPEQAQEVHKYIREWINDQFGESVAETIRILYGGSVKPENAKDLMSRPDIDGALVGGASLKSDLFIPIIKFNA